MGSPAFSQLVPDSLKERLVTRIVSIAKGVATTAVVLVLPLLPAPARAASPMLTLSRTVGAPTSQFFASGTGFQPGESVEIDFDQTFLFLLVTDPSGNFTHSGPLHVPSTATPGMHTVTATGQSSGLTATHSFLVRTNWPRYHFDNGNTGYNRFENVLNPTNVSSLVEKWSVPTASGSSPNPIIAGGFVYVAPADGIVRALDPATGATVWATDTGGTMDQGFAPTYSNGLLYVGNDSGDALALDAKTGSIVWDVSLGLEVDSTPVVADHVVYVGAYADSTDTGYALDAATGTTKLTMAFSLSNAPSFAYGVVNTVYTYGGQIVGVNASNGQVVWEWADGQEVAGTDSPAVSNGTVYAAVEVPLYSVNDQTGKLNWKAGVGGFGVSTPSIANGVIYYDSGKYLSAWNSRTGEMVWKTRIPGSGTSVVTANGVAYIGTLRGSLQAYNTSTGALLWESATRGASFGGSLVVADGVVYASSNDGTIHAFGLP
jgi:outer membrane protein assembly factor BamB